MLVLVALEESKSECERVFPMLRLPKMFVNFSIALAVFLCDFPL